MAPVVGPGRFEFRLQEIGPGVTYDSGCFGWHAMRVWGEGVDRATGEVAWIISSSPHAADKHLRTWASAVANPFTPTWREEKGMTPARRERQRVAKKLWKKELAERGQWVEAEQNIRSLVARGALFAVSHSGGKDSQAMLIRLRHVVPDEQILVVHAPLVHVEWEGALEKAREQTPPGSPFLLAAAIDQHGEEKWLLDWVLQRGKWPDAARRWCTAEWKRGPIRRELRRYADEHGFSIIVEALGLRAEESERRADAPALEPLADEHGKRSVKTKRPREWYTWLPIKWLTTEEVFATIRGAGQEPLWTYAEGMTRASCAFCVLAQISDLRRAAQLAPDLYAVYVAVEKVVDEASRRATGKPHTMRQGRTIEEITGIEADPKLVAQHVRAIRRTGDLSGIEIASAVARPAMRRVAQLQLYPGDGT